MRQSTKAADTWAFRSSGVVKLGRVPRLLSQALNSLSF